MQLELDSIYQRLETSASLNELLESTVHELQSLLEVSVCSLYLHDLESNELVMVATVGLKHRSIGQVRMALDEGIVGLVAQRAEPISLTDAQEHARFRFFPGIGEEGLSIFLGVPIIYQRQNLGVITLQKREGIFDDEVASQLVTFAARLAQLIASFNGLALLKLPKGRKGLKVENHHYHGVTGAPGVALGRAVVVDSELDLASVTDAPVGEVAEEIGRFRNAVVAVQRDLVEMGHNWKEAMAEGDKAIFDAYIMILQSSSFAEAMEQKIRAGEGAVTAVRHVVATHMAAFARMSDAYLRQRGEDIYELGRRVVTKLQQDGNSGRRQYPRNTILVAHEISAAMIAEVPPKRLRGIVSLKGSRTSHSAILARSLKIPAVLGVDNLPFSSISGSEIAIDGDSGEIFLKPSALTRRNLRIKQQQREQQQSRFETIRDLPAVTLDGHRVRLYANSGLIADLNTAISCGAEGIGLYRTEYPFMIRSHFPGEEEQLKIYRKILQTLTPQPVTMRTLDIGGDKALPYFPIEEANPFLGWRGIRFTLDHPDIFLVQIRAMLRANIGCHNLRILLPMISHLNELDSAIKLIHQAHDELQGEYAGITLPPIGAMIEVPSAVYQAHCIARRVDFLSIGSNDLTQYILAVDRNNARVASLYDSFHPAVIQALAQVVEAAQKSGKELSICGEMAGNPAAARLIIGLGINVLSMNASSIPEVKQAIRQTNLAALQRDMADLRNAESAEALVSLLHERICIIPTTAPLELL